MDSFNRLKDFVGNLSELALRKKERVYDGIFSMMLTTEGLCYAYVKHNKETFELQAANTVPYTLKDLGKVLTYLDNQYNLSNAACSWLLTSDKYQLLQVEDLPVPPEEFQSAIRWQIKKLLSYAVDDAFIDRFTIPPAQTTNPKKYIQIVAAQASYIQPIAEIIIESGLNLTTIDIQELSLRNITSLFENDDKGTALVYLQEKTSIITISKQKLFYFSRKLDWSLEVLTTADTLEQAHEYFDKLALELHRSFDYFQGQWRQGAPTRILVAPVVATAIDIAAYLSQRLSLTIQTLNLNSVMRSKITLDANTQGKYLPLIGAALRKENTYATTS